MANLPISGLPDVDVMDGSELLAVAQAEVTKRVSISDIFTAFGGGSEYTPPARALGTFSDDMSESQTEGVASLVHDGVGRYTVNFTPGLFSAPPVVTAMTWLTEAQVICWIEDLDANSVQFRVKLPGGGGDTDVQISFQAFAMVDPVSNIGGGGGG